MEFFFAGELGGAVVYADEASENLGVWNRYGFTGKIITLARGACLPWAHPHAASKLIRRSMDLLPERYKIVTATVDAFAGEVGTIYQACGFDYVGTMRQGGRALIRVNGKHLSERQVGRLVGTRGARALARLGFDAIPVPRRARYFAFRGSKQQRKHNRAAIGCPGRFGYAAAPNGSAARCRAKPCVGSSASRQRLCAVLAATLHGSAIP